MAANHKFIGYSRCSKLPKMNFEPGTVLNICGLRFKGHMTQTEKGFDFQVQNYVCPYCEAWLGMGIDQKLPAIASCVNCRKVFWIQPLEKGTGVWIKPSRDGDDGQITLVCEDKWSIDFKSGSLDDNELDGKSLRDFLR